MFQARRWWFTGNILLLFDCYKYSKWSGNSDTVKIILSPEKWSSNSISISYAQVQLSLWKQFA